jgi:hypothetical protein
VIEQRSGTRGRRVPAGEGALSGERGQSFPGDGSTTDREGCDGDRASGTDHHNEGAGGEAPEAPARVTIGTPHPSALHSRRRHAVFAVSIGREGAAAGEGHITLSCRVIERRDRRLRRRREKKKRRNKTKGQKAGSAIPSNDPRAVEEREILGAEIVVVAVGTAASRDLGIRDGGLQQQSL